MTDTQDPKGDQDVEHTTEIVNPPTEDKAEQVIEDEDRDGILPEGIPLEQMSTEDRVRLGAQPASLAYLASHEGINTLKLPPSDNPGDEGKAPESTQEPIAPGSMSDPDRPVDSAPEDASVT